MCNFPLLYTWSVVTNVSFRGIHYESSVSCMRHLTIHGSSRPGLQKKSPNSGRQEGIADFWTLPLQFVKVNGLFSLMSSCPSMSVFDVFGSGCVIVHNDRSLFLVLQTQKTRFWPKVRQFPQNRKFSERFRDVILNEAFHIDNHAEALKIWRWFL